MKAGHQNIQGGGSSKLAHKDLVNKVKAHHLFGAQETKLGKENEAPDIEGYVKFRSDRSKKSKRESGGSLIYVKKSMARGVTLLSKRSNISGDVIWIRLKKEFFGIEEDILLSYCYIVPNAKQDAYDILNDEIIKYSPKGVITILGDLNSRIGLKPLKHSEITVKNSQTIVELLDVAKRSSEDTKVNSNGRKLRNIMSSFNYVMANGTILGDLGGKYTCIAWNGMSTNDVFLFDRKLSSRVNYFKVNDSFDWYSDHKSISVSLRVNIYLNQEGNDSNWKLYQKANIKWDQENIEKFKNTIFSEKYKQKFDEFCTRNFDSTNGAEKAFNKIISEVLKETFPACKLRKNAKNNKRNRRGEVYSPMIQMAKREFRKCQREFDLNQCDVNRRHKLIRQRQKYKKIIYFTKKLFKENKINKVVGLETSDPSTFWKELKSLINPNNDFTEYIEKNDWFNHFNELLNSPSALHQDKQFLEYIKLSLPRLELYEENVEILNSPIKNSEISECMKELKMGKSTYFDNIGNEVIKYGYNILEEPLNKLYNKVFASCTFPTAWGDGIVVPLHKKNDKMDVNNYRGIIISNCVGKLFLRIINKRINDFMSKHDKWSKNQCGFKKDHRTEDNLFLLKTIHDKYVKRQNKKIYVAFVDFSKFFDKINRHVMLYKLLKYGITGNIYRLIKSIYSNTAYCIKIGDRVSPIFSASNGLKQGCCLSPILSNIFQNDLHNIFDNKCDPVSVGSAVFNSISWADDLVLMSTSKEGLQQCLNKLFEYCKRWGLEVNIDKTKTMVFSNKVDKSTTFTFNNAVIENVQVMTYLGFNLSYNGSVQSIMSDRILKAKKVAGMVLNALRTNKNVSTKLAVDIYEKQIAPVLTYGCPIWSVPRNGNLIYIENIPENVHIRHKVNEIFTKLAGSAISFDYAKRVGKYVVDKNRRVLVKVSNFEDKCRILSLNHDEYIISNYKEIVSSDTEKAHLNFCKSSLNISKYASNNATYYELGLKPIDNKMHSLAIKYWLRLTRGTSNFMLNECFKLCSSENFEWVQGIHALLMNNGYGNVWNYPHTVSHLSFHKIFKQRLDDQFVQILFNNIETSNRFELLQNFLNRENLFTAQNYVLKIKNPAVREIFTRLRVDMNILENSKVNIEKSLSGGRCKNCHVKETPQHLLFECTDFAITRSKAYDSIKNKDPLFDVASMSIYDLMKYVLNLECPDKCVSECCSMVNEIYNARKDMNDACENLL